MRGEEKSSYTGKKSARKARNMQIKAAITKITKFLNISKTIHARIIILMSNPMFSGSKITLKHLECCYRHAFWGNM